MISVCYWKIVDHRVVFDGPTVAALHLDHVGNVAGEVIVNLDVGGWSCGMQLVLE